MTTVAEIRAIPTEYRGIRFRSRFEADTAFYFDQEGWTWKYEPRSFLLPSGIHYMPDFYLPNRGKMKIGEATAWWVECRGYETEKGNAQLREFPAVMPPNDLYFVVRPGGAHVFENLEVFISNDRLRRFWAYVWQALEAPQTTPFARAAFFDRYCEPEFLPPEAL